MSVRIHSSDKTMRAASVRALDRSLPTRDERVAQPAEPLEHDPEGSSLKHRQFLQSLNDNPDQQFASYGFIQRWMKERRGPRSLCYNIGYDNSMQAMIADPCTCSIAGHGSRNFSEATSVDAILAEVQTAADSEPYDILFVTPGDYDSLATEVSKVSPTTHVIAAVGREHAGVEKQMRSDGKNAVGWQEYLDNLQSNQLFAELLGDQLLK